MKNKLYLITIFLVVSCSSVDSKKYEDFGTSVRKLNANFENTFQVVQKKSREHGIQKFTLNPNSKPADLMISIEGYNWKMDKAPLYLTLKKTSMQLIKMNDLFGDYVDLLVQLATSSLTKEELVSSAKDLDKRSSELAETIGVNGDKKQFTMLSSAAVGLLQSYIDYKKEKKLTTAVKKNQSSVENLASLQIKLIHILRNNLKQTYNEEFFEFSKKWSSSSSKKQISSSLFDLNDSLIASLALYEGLEFAYKAIPQGHKELAKAKDSHSFKSKIERLVKSSNKIFELQKQVSKKEGDK